LSHEVLEAASAAGGICDQTLESLVSGCLNLDFLGGEDDPVGDLTALRGQMVRALAQLGATLEELKKRQVRRRCGARVSSVCRAGLSREMQQRNRLRIQIARTKTGARRVS
jgi:hypothetical protein